MSKTATAKSTTPFTDDELNLITRAANATLDYIAGDTLQLMRECEGRSYIKQDEVIEMVIDADRLVTIGKLPRELNERIYALAPREQSRMFRRIFPHKRYS